MKKFILNMKVFLEPTKENRKVVRWLLAVEMSWVLWFLWVNILFQKFLQTIEFHRWIDQIIIYGSIIVFIIIIMFIIRLLTHKLDPKNISSFKKYLYRKYLKKYMLLDNQEVYKYGTWKFISIINAWIEHRVDALSIWLFDMIRYIVWFLFNLVFIAYIQPSLIIPVIIFSIFMFIWMHKVWQKTYPHREEMVNTEDSISKQVVLMIMEKFTILKNDKIDQEQKKLHSLLEKSEHHSIKSYFYNSLLYSWSQTIVDLAKVVFIIFIGIQTFYNNGSIADIATVILVSNFLSNYVQNFTYAYRDITTHIVRLFKLVNIFNEIPTIKKYDQWTDFKFTKWNISFEDIHFAYSDKKEIFEKFNVQIKWWFKTAILWKSWVGKTTLIKLIMWFVRPQYGKIIVDEQDLENVSLKTYYKYIGYLSQEVPVFDWTVLENILYGIDEEVDQKKLQEIIQLSECNYIYGLENWLDTEIWEKWVMLSWWERQRLAIARLFLQNPKIIILDEPTSSLDIDSEIKINKALHNLFKWRTVITIAHKLETIKDFDDIILLWKNNVVARGNMNQLEKEIWNFKDFFA